MQQQAKVRASHPVPSNQGNCVNNSNQGNSVNNSNQGNCINISNQGAGSSPWLLSPGSSRQIEPSIMDVIEEKDDESMQQSARSACIHVAADVTVQKQGNGCDNDSESSGQSTGGQKGRGADDAHASDDDNDDDFDYDDVLFEYDDDFESTVETGQNEDGQNWDVEDKSSDLCGGHLRCSSDVAVARSGFGAPRPVQNQLVTKNKHSDKPTQNHASNMHVRASKDGQDKALGTSPTQNVSDENGQIHFGPKTPKRRYVLVMYV
jgi:hypothetical protein